MTIQSIHHELPAALTAEVGLQRYEPSKLFGTVLAFARALAARVVAAHRAAQAEHVRRILRSGLAAID